MKVCIIGGVAGGASAATRLRRLDEKMQILLFERGKYVSFANCGLPYHISGTIADREDLLVQTPEGLKTRFRIDVRTQSEVLRIDRIKRQLQVRSATGQLYYENYDKLVLAPGAEPFVPPITTHNEASFFTLRDIPDLDRIMTELDQNKPTAAVVIGGGFIGVEVAENLSQRGINTHLVELSNQLLAPLDYEMAVILHEEMRNRGISLHLGTNVSELFPDKVRLKSGDEISMQLCISAVGVKPESALAIAAGLDLGKTGGILVNEYMQTTDPDIYAVGDVIEIQNFVTDDSALIPLAGPANKQGRIAADNIAGIKSSYKKTLGTGILKVFNLQAAFTGISEKVARKRSLNYQAIHLHPRNHAGYYPGATTMTLKLIFEKPSGRILGAQGVGPNGVDKRIDVIATAMRAGLKANDLAELELCYAPPFGAAKDPVNMAGFMATNILQGHYESITYDRLPELTNAFLIAVCTIDECSVFKMPGEGRVIPLDELREHLAELPSDRPLVVYCMQGLRGYLGCRILKQAGFKSVYNLSGGILSAKNYAE